MPQETDETYSVIYSALKHPVRRKILRMLNEEELTYTQILTALDLDTGHLNFYLDSLGELLAKTDGKYRLSEFGKAATKLMVGVEETDILPKESAKTRFTRRKVTRISQVISIIALVIAGGLLISISNSSEYPMSSQGQLNEVNILKPNGVLSQNFLISLRDFPVNTLTNYYSTYLLIKIDRSNATLLVKVAESVFPMGNIPLDSSDKYFESPVLICNETVQGPTAADNDTLLSSTSPNLYIPVQSPIQKGILNSNSFVQYNINITNLGGERVLKQSDGSIRLVHLPNDSASFGDINNYFWIKETNYPFIYGGMAFLFTALIVAIIPILPLLIKRKV